jgi:phosphoglycolate phosphatase
MTALFAALGFPADRLDEAIRYYRDNFARDYPVHMFPGTPEMLQQLHAAGAVMGVVTANLRVNVKVALGPNWDLFRPDLRFTADDEFQRTKAGALLYAAEILQVEPQEITYLGDQLGDYEAARQAGTRFLGATWGWAIARGDARFETVDTPSEIEAYFAKRRNVQEEKGRS